jgi:hypothetical protein
MWGRNEKALAEFSARAIISACRFGYIATVALHRPVRTGAGITPIRRHSRSQSETVCFGRFQSAASVSWLSIVRPSAMRCIMSSRAWAFDSPVGPGLFGLGLRRPPDRGGSGWKNRITFSASTGLKSDCPVVSEATTGAICTFCNLLSDTCAPNAINVPASPFAPSESIPATSRSSAQGAQPRRSAKRPVQPRILPLHALRIALSCTRQRGALGSNPHAQSMAADQLQISKGTARMSDKFAERFPPSIVAAKLYERTSAKGNPYLTGRLGVLRVALLKTQDTDDEGHAIWEMRFSAASARSTQPKTKTSSREPVPQTDGQHAQPRPPQSGFNKSLDDEIPF